MTYIYAFTFSKAQLINPAVTRLVKNLPAFCGNHPQCSAERIPPLNPILNDANPIQILKQYFSHICFTITYPSTTRSPKWFLPSVHVLILKSLNLLVYSACDKLNIICEGLKSCFMICDVQTRYFINPFPPLPNASTLSWKQNIQNNVSETKIFC